LFRLLCNVPTHWLLVQTHHPLTTISHLYSDCHSLSLSPGPKDTRCHCSHCRYQEAVEESSDTWLEIVVGSAASSNHEEERCRQQPFKFSIVLAHPMILVQPQQGSRYAGIRWQQCSPWAIQPVGTISRVGWDRVVHDKVGEAVRWCTLQSARTNSVGLSSPDGEVTHYQHVVPSASACPLNHQWHKKHNPSPKTFSNPGETQTETLTWTTSYDIKWK